MPCSFGKSDNGVFDATKANDNVGCLRGDESVNSQTGRGLEGTGGCGLSVSLGGAGVLGCNDSSKGVGILVDNLEVEGSEFGSQATGVPDVNQSSGSFGVWGTIDAPTPPTGRIGGASGLSKSPAGAVIVGGNKSSEFKPGAEMYVFMEACIGGASLPHTLRSYAERLLGIDLEDTRVLRSSSVEMLGVAAVTVGERIVLHPSVWEGFDDEHTTRLLVHELTHVAQQRAHRIPLQNGIVLDGALEAEAELIAERAIRELAFSNPERRPPALQVHTRLGWLKKIVLQPHPAMPILRRAVSWFGKRSAKALTKHIATHTRRNFEKPIHSVFRSVNAVRPLIKRTLEEGLQLSEQFAKKNGFESIESGGVKLTRQISQKTPGKSRWLLQKKFGNAIGTKGEKVLCIVLDMSGRLVTAFPADKLLSILGSAIAVDLLSESIANAAENVEAEAERLANFEEMQRNKIDLWEFVPFIGDIWGGNLNEFEDLELAHDRWINQVVKDVIDGAESRAGQSFGNRLELEVIVRIGRGLPVLLEHGE